MDVVVVLADIVDQPGIALRIGGCANLLDGLSGMCGAFEQFIAFHHIGIVVLVVVKFEGLPGHERCECIVVIWKGWQFEGHFCLRSGSGFVDGYIATTPSWTSTHAPLPT